MKSRDRETRGSKAADPDRLAREKKRRRRERDGAETPAKRHGRANDDGPPYRDEKGRISGGNPGNKGGGRPSNAFVRVCKRLSLTAMRRKVRRVLRNPDHVHFMSALKMAAAYGWGQPSQSVEVQGKLTLEHLVAGSYDDEQEQD